MRKNTTGQYVAFQAISKTDGSDVITGTPVVYYTIDGGTQAQTTATAVHEGNGQWSVALSQAETNGDHIVFSFVLTGAVTQTVNVYTLDADLTNLDVAVSTRSIFDATTDTVTTDAASRTASQADVSSLATAAALATVDANVDSILVDTGTDIPASIAALNDLSSTDVETAVWDASLSSHNTGGTTGKSLKQIKEGTITIESSINDASATTTSFVTALTETTTSYYSNKIMVFIDGHLSGQARIITNYDGTTKTITLEEPLTSAPSDGDQFLILATHENSIAEIADSVWDEAQSGHTTVGTFGYYLDAQVSAAGVTPPTAAAIADAVWDEVRSPDHVTEGTFGYYVDAQVSSAGAGGSGLYQVTVNVQNQSAQALQGARINVDGTTLTLVTDSAGQCVFNLDSGVYLLTISPPAGYDTVSGNTVTVVTSDISSTFTLTATSSASCDVPWIG